MTIMRRTAFALAGPVLVGACAGTPDTSGYDHIEVTQYRPNCEYRVLGSVEAKSGSYKQLTSFGREMAQVWGEQGSMAEAEAILRAKAAELGADRVVIRFKRWKEQDVSGSLARRGASQVTLLGTAITKCLDETGTD